MLLCAFKSRQVVELKRRIKEIDPYAFLIVSDAYEVLGEGFLPHDPKNKRQPKTPQPQTERGEAVQTVPFWERPVGISVPPEPLREPSGEMPDPPAPLSEAAPVESMLAEPRDKEDM